MFMLFKMNVPPQRLFPLLAFIFFSLPLLHLFLQVSKTLKILNSRCYFGTNKNQFTKTEACTRKINMNVVPVDELIFIPP